MDRRFSMWAITQDVSSGAIGIKGDQQSLHGRNGYVPMAVNNIFSWIYIKECKECTQNIDIKLYVFLIVLLP